MDFLACYLLTIGSFVKSHSINLYMWLHCRQTRHCCFLSYPGVENSFRNFLLLLFHPSSSAYYCTVSHSHNLFLLHSTWLQSAELKTFGFFLPPVFIQYLWVRGLVKRKKWVTLKVLLKVMETPLIEL